MTNPTLDALIAARGYVERGWTQGAYARDAKGDFKSAYSDDAVRWCVSGAMIAAGAFSQLCGVLESFVPDGGHIPGWNDAPGRTQADVLALFDRAIEAQSSKGGQ